LLALNEITFVSFNYDRCIEQFFVNSALEYFILGNNECQNIVDHLNIIYPYGNVGDMDWSYVGERTFGMQLTADSLILASEGIRTFTEGVADTAVIEEIRNSLKNCDLVLLLGFGFHRLNMNLVFGESTYNIQKVYATGYGNSTSFNDSIRDELMKIFRQADGRKLKNEKDLQIIHATASELIDEFRRDLTG